MPNAASGTSHRRGNTRFGAGLALDEISRQTAACIGAAAPEFTTPFARVFDRLASDQWAFEWQLPRVLGEAYNLPATTITAVCSANVLGLCAIRLLDDLADQAHAARSKSAIMLANACFTQALLSYLRQINILEAVDRAAFLDCIDLHMARWTGACMATAPQHKQPYEDGLSARGAPLQITVMAICLLAGRKEALPPLAAAIDNVLCALILLDDYLDWREDLALGRHNRFVAHVSSRGQDARHRSYHKRRVVRGLLDQAVLDGYFARVSKCLSSAAALATGAHSQGLGALLDWLNTRVDNFARRERGKARRAVRDTTGLLFGAVTRPVR
jgi:hypothetical protein